MMKKEWYIFQGSHHKGPYTIDELKLFYQEGSLKRETLVWKEGVEEWEPLFKIKALSRVLGEENLDIPNLPMDLPLEDKQINADLPPIDSLIEDDVPPPLPPIDQNPKKSKRVLAKAPEVFRDPTRLDLPPVPELMELLNGKQKNKWSWINKKWSLALVVFVLIGFGIYLSLKGFTSVPKSLYIRGLNPSNLERLEEVVQRPITSLTGEVDQRVDLALTVNGKEIWLASNIADEAVLQMTLTSKPNRLLANQEVIIETRARLVNHQARFSKMRILKGSVFVPGEYTYKIKMRKIHTINSLIPSLQSLGFFAGLNTDEVLTGDAIIYSGSKTDFEYRLIEYRKEILSNVVRPFEEKLEKVSTLREIVNKTNDSLAIIFEKKAPQKEMKDFEAFFIKEISPMLQTIVNDSLDKNETEIVEAAKNFGESVTELMTYVEKQKKWGAPQKDDADKAVKRLKSQSLFLEIQMKKIEGEIKKIKENP